MKKTTALTMVILLQTFSWTADASKSLTEQSAEVIARGVLNNTIPIKKLETLTENAKTEVDTHLKKMRTCPAISKADLLTNQTFNISLPVQQTHTNFANGHITIHGLNYNIKATEFLVNGATAHSVDNFLNGRFYPLNPSTHNPTFENKPIPGAISVTQENCVYSSVDPDYGYFYLVVEKPGIQ
ncbi:hypothetical protein IM40_02665 [Candidatus Paracaedimonas acanthamoebae]|nr:hypothetical protein IM40_02665 [Candidatus Paracaedimonas acanthamoebae]